MAAILIIILVIVAACAGILLCGGINLIIAQELSRLEFALMLIGLVAMCAIILFICYVIIR